jgi:hypothetical protein
VKQRAAAPSLRKADAGAFGFPAVHTPELAIARTAADEASQLLACAVRVENDLISSGATPSLSPSAPVREPRGGLS